MNLRLPKVPDFSRPHGLQARAVMFTSALMALTAAVSAAILIFGAQTEGERQQIGIAHDLTEYLASRAGDVMAHGNTRVLEMMIQGSTQQRNVRAISIRDANNNVLAQTGGSDADNAAMTQLSARALADQAVVYSRGRDGAVTVAAPIVRQGQVIGVALRMWEASAYKFDAFPSLTPFLLIVACLALAAIPLTALAVRRAIAPLDELARYAEQVGELGQAAPITMRTGDEFETLANAFNNMTGRLDASMRQIQEIAFVDPVTRLPNQDRFIREVDYFILQNKTGQSTALRMFVAKARPGISKPKTKFTNGNLMPMASRPADERQAPNQPGGRIDLVMFALPEQSIAATGCQYRRQGSGGCFALPAGLHVPIFPSGVDTLCGIGQQAP